MNAPIRRAGGKAKLATKIAALYFASPLGAAITVALLVLKGRL